MKYGTGWRRLVSGLAALTVAAGAAGLGAPGAASAQGPDGSAKKAKKIVRLGVAQSVDNMNPFLALRVVSTSIQRWTYGFLTVPDSKTLRPSPDLAESWTTSADKLTWTFTMRAAKWSDGTPITAHDAAWTFNTIMTNDAAKQANGPAVENFASVVAKDDRTLVITTERPQATMLENPVPIVPRHVFANAGPIGSYDAERYPMVASGPFTVVEHKRDAYVRLRANPGYWRGPAKIDELHVIFYENPEAANAGLKRGDVDWVGRLAAPQYQAFDGDPAFRQWDTPGRRATYLQLNPGARTIDDRPVGDGHPALRDRRVREAIHRAVDKETLVRQVQNGLARVADGAVVPPVFPEFHWSAQGDDLVTFDPARANEILDRAGYRRGPDGVRTMPEGGPDAGRRLAMRFSVHAADPVEGKIAQYLTGWLRAIGVELTTKRLDATRFTEETGYTGLYDIAISGYSVNPDPEEILATHLCSRRPTAKGEGGGTESFFCDKEYERLYRDQLAELDRGRRVEIVKRMQRRLYTEAPVIALYYPNNLEVYRQDRIKSITPMPERNGFLYGGPGYWPVYTVEAAEAAPGAAGPGTGVLVGVGAALAVTAVAGVALARRRRATADDRE
ncbi:ABC transporter substrate-binding protein [Spongiactinospora sp. TRM90649]|uniref:ABC transporter substrate-binding protein n=1 Tax=Spongiactinospora sp. TRM90649 TaxID=3031114 RepID=UPI0023F98BEA|nr:ABC transporter substrate-binding protein [Spongiactinospora sp. TRM90649]MDF5753677.1 ABC transporter substrate-binding protein [Spongiactinospora sp. TRM90649]